MCVEVCWARERESEVVVREVEHFVLRVMKRGARTEGRAVVRRMGALEAWMSCFTALR